MSFIDDPERHRHETLRKARAERSHDTRLDPVTSTDTERAERLAFIDEFVEMFPETRRNTASGVEHVAALVNILGRLSTTEVGRVLEVTRQRVEQIELVSLRKVRLKGGVKLREAWESTVASDTLGMWDAMELYSGE